MSAPVRDPLQIPPDLQARVEAVPGLRAFYRRASLLRVFGLACLPLAATALSYMALAFTGTELGPPSWAQVRPAMDQRTRAGSCSSCWS